jgi:hypothetical protein
LSRGLRLVHIVPRSSESMLQLLRRLATAANIAQHNPGVLLYATDARTYEASLMGAHLGHLDKPFLCYYKDEFYRCFGPDPDGSLDQGFRVWLAGQTTGCRQECCICLEDSEAVNVGGSGCVRCSAWLCGACLSRMPKASSCPASGCCLTEQLCAGVCKVQHKPTSINATDTDSWTALHWTAFGGQLPVMHYLCAAGCWSCTHQSCFCHWTLARCAPTWHGSWSSREARHKPAKDAALAQIRAAQPLLQPLHHRANRQTHRTCGCCQRA